MRVKVDTNNSSSQCIKYPCVMLGNGGVVGFAANEDNGILFSNNCVEILEGPSNWIALGFRPATGPVTITLEND